MKLQDNSVKIPYINNDNTAYHTLKYRISALKQRISMMNVLHINDEKTGYQR